MTNQDFQLLKLSLGNFWAFFNTAKAVFRLTGDAKTAKVKFGESAYNPGRSANWQNPETDIPLRMLDGYEISKGAMVAVPMSKVGELFADLAKKAATKSSPLYDNEAAKLYRKIAKDPIKHAMAERAERIAQLEAMGDHVFKYRVDDDTDEDGNGRIVEISAKAVADVLRSVIDVEPSYAIFCGQRRAFAAPWLVALRLELGMDDEYQWIAHPRDIVTAEELTDTILDENNRAGQSDYDEASRVANAVRLYDLHSGAITELALGEEVGYVDVVDSATGATTHSQRGARQKLFRLVQLCVKYPKLRILERIQMEPSVVKSGVHKGELEYEPGGYLPVRKLDKELLQSLLGKKAKPHPVVKAVCGEDARIATMEECEQAFEAVMVGAKPKAAFGKSSLETFAGLDRIARSVATVGDVLNAIVKGDKAFFDSLTPPDGETAEEFASAIEGDEGDES